VTRPPLPEAFVQRVRHQLGLADAAALIRALSGAPALGLRANPRHGSPNSLAERLGWRAAPVPWCPEGIVLDAPEAGRHPAGRHPWHEGGAYYLQDPSAMGVVPLLDPRPGDLVLDLAAAPGGKATHLAGRLGDRGLLWAHDTTPQRADALAANLERWGARAAVVSQGDARPLSRLAGAFDRVLVDAPCSGEGMFRKSDAARERWSPARVNACARIQSGLLDLAADLVRPGGVLVYATCTFAPEEDEAVVEALLERRPDLWLADLDAKRLRPAATDPGAAPVGEGSVRWWPHRGVGDGHFAARFGRDAPAGDGAPVARSISSRRGAARGRPPIRQATAVSDPERSTWQAFARETLGGDPLPDHELLSADGALTAVPAAALELGGPWRRAGVALGRVVSGRRGERRFEPHHALSRVLPAHGAAAAHVDLATDDPRVFGFLRGESVDVTGIDGWGLLRAAGVPLGWVKARSGVANNHYPRGLRRDLLRAPAEPEMENT
jgi:16S rRNA C967 or C1407 C5-methylase (RsmB/RsmF family)/NOL1/NOP2/fmu family ribosome biogenesis protein